MKRLDYLGMAILLGVWEISARGEATALIMGAGSIGYFFAYLWSARKP